MANQRDLIADLCDGASDAETLATIVHRVQLTWSDHTTHPDPTPLAALFGVALGDLLIRRVPGLGWVLLCDHQRCELAVAHATAPLAVFPLSATAQHWPDLRREWVLPYVEQVVATIRADLEAEAID